MSNKDFFKANHVKKAKLHNGLVAYLDFLGIQTKILTDENSYSSYDETLAKVIDLFNGTLAEFSNHALLKQFDFKYKIFSDNIAIFLDIEEKTNRELYTLMMELMGFVAFFQCQALKEKMLVRGGMSIGKYFVNSDLCWGKALVEAVNMEKNSVFPRVLICDELTAIMNNEYTINSSHLINKDKDEKYYVDYLSIVTEIQVYKDIIFTMYNDIREKLNSNKEEDRKILDKYKWLVEYVEMSQLSLNQ